MISCKINRQACFGLPVLIDNQYNWENGSYITILKNPHVSSTLFYSEDRWICIARILSDSSTQHRTAIKKLTQTGLQEIYVKFSSLEAEGILIETACGKNGNTLRIIATNEGSIPIYFSNLKSTIHLDWDFKKICSTMQDLTLDFEYLVKSTFEHTYTHRTAFQGISMLTAGSACIFSDDTCDYKYLEIDPPTAKDFTNISTNEAVSIFNLLLKEKIHSQLSENHLVAIELSGGLDSSTIAAMYAQCFPHKKVNTYGIIVSDQTLSKCQQDRRRRIISHINGNDHNINIIDHLPSLTSSARDKYYLNSEAYGHAFETIWQRAALDGLNILLSGAGGDELFPQYLDEDFSKDRLRSFNDQTWDLYTNLLISRLSPKAQDVLDSQLLTCAPKKIVDTGMLLAMARRSPLLLQLNLVPIYPFRDSKIIKFCNSLPKNLRLNKNLLTNILNKTIKTKKFSNYPKETFMHADEVSLLQQKRYIIDNCNNFRIFDIGLISKMTFMRDMESINADTPRYVFDYLLNILSIERFLRAYV